MLISQAYAAAGTTPATGFDPFSILLPVAIFLVFYVLWIRPQQMRQKQHETTIAGLRRGDRIVTAGGLIGTVVRVTDDEVLVEIADGVRVKVVRSTIAALQAKTEPESAESTAKNDKS